ncbi:hypothetical protein BSKO_08125 [Bryopsis sp. KO-2023]|nr:hypothetical protein BSKO_05767 [Bryopsis sp. KO-2023]GMH40221.1 hypothetical protein BSKO_08125 [Bryopsis sp. KO-2023]
MTVGVPLPGTFLKPLQSSLVVLFDPQAIRIHVAQMTHRPCIFRLRSLALQDNIPGRLRSSFQCQTHLRIKTMLFSYTSLLVIHSSLKRVP